MDMATNRTTVKAAPGRKNPDVDLGLAVIAALDLKVPWTQTAIAAVCQCSLQNIQHIERRALQKLRHAARQRGL